jgi:hypothetical protein
MSAPHTYVTDRLCFVISGTWWVNSGETFEPENTVPVPRASATWPEVFFRLCHLSQVLAVCASHHDACLPLGFSLFANMISARYRRRERKTARASKSALMMCT